MKTTQHTSKRTKGMTLLELTVVILVLLSLISILFIGARAWKKGSDRTANILNIRNIQQAVRSHSNMNGMSAGSSVLYHETIFAGSDGNSGISNLVGANYLAEPMPPAASGVDGYVYLNIVPAMGTLYVVNVDLANPEGDYFYTGTASNGFGGTVSGW
ncbi:MAG: hypothetical protein ABJQ29_09020 [Luteolibacter sp.]